MLNRFQWREEEEQTVATFMERVAALPAAAPSVNANYLWWKAQLIRRWDAERKAQIPLDVIQPIEIATGLVVVALLFYWSLGRLF